MTTFAMKNILRPKKTDHSAHLSLFATILFHGSMKSTAVELKVIMTGFAFSRSIFGATHLKLPRKVFVFHHSKQTPGIKIVGEAL